MPVETPVRSDSEVELPIVIRGQEKKPGQRHRSLSVKWRWQLAVELSRTGHFPSHEDDWVQEAAQFLFLLPSETEAVGNLPFKFHRKGGIEQAVVEARLLAGNAITEVATRSDLDDVVVAAYTALFFDVSDDQQRKW